MSAGADLKCNFADLKYEQLLSDKYFIETCFSKSYSSYPAKQRLIDMLFEIRSETKETFAFTTTAYVPDCSHEAFSSEFSNEFE